MPKIEAENSMLNFEVRSENPENTVMLASSLATVVTVGDVIVLSGDLGAGKTCFAKGFAKGLGVDELVTSPTFTLVNQYEARIPLYHLDVYRLNSIDETFDLGLDEIFDSGVCVIEWGEQIVEVLPEGFLHIHLRHETLAEPGVENVRIVAFESTSPLWKQKLEQAKLVGLDRNDPKVSNNDQ